MSEGKIVLFDCFTLLCIKFIGINLDANLLPPSPPTFSFLRAWMMYTGGILGLCKWKPVILLDFIVKFVRKIWHQIQ